MKIIALFGKTCSGKTTLLKKLCEKGTMYHTVPYYSTRENKDNENTYGYVHIDDINDIPKDTIIHDSVYNTKFGTWHYILSDKYIRKNANITYALICDIDTLKALIDKYGDDVIPVYVYSSFILRVLRQGDRIDSTKRDKETFIEECDRRNELDIRQYSKDVVSSLAKIKVCSNNRLNLHFAIKNITKYILDIL